MVLARDSSDPAEELGNGVAPGSAAAEERPGGGLVFALAALAAALAGTQLR